MEITKAMNKLPVATYRWLNVNEFNLNENINMEKSPYVKEYLRETINKDIIIKKINNAIDIKNYTGSLIGNELEYGVSKELAEHGENSYNTGIFAYVPEGIKAKDIIRLEYELDNENNLVVDKNIIIAGKDSKLTIIIDYSTLDYTKTLHNGITKIFAKEGSDITLIKIQRMNDKSYHFDSNIAYIDYGARVNYIQVEIGSKKAVTNYTNNLKDNGEAYIDSIYLGDGKREIDLNYLMNHRGKRSISNIQTRGALKDRAKKVFKGTIDFETGASKAVGCEEEYVLVFDKNVKTTSIPLLLCSEDDVRGQHAASIGKVDNEKLFYMMSRGFSKGEAMKIAVQASFNPIIDKIPLEHLRKIIDKEIHGRLLHGKI
ncbi:MAG: Fe-S cluster assembly protein SufD [Epulopiscium sp.]|nr:Fe-S cluster assembly protein SufD [Candidatus Epulonipiscium sp.]